MEFGIHSLLFTETFLDKDLPLLDKCKGMGFDAVEIIPFDPDNFPARRVKAVRSLLSRRGASTRGKVPSFAPAAREVSDICFPGITCRRRATSNSSTIPEHPSTTRWTTRC